MVIKDEDLLVTVLIWLHIAVTVLSDDIITTIAGTGAASYGGDNNKLYLFFLLLSTIYIGNVYIALYTGIIFPTGTDIFEVITFKNI